MSMLGSAFAGTTLPMIQNFTGPGTPPVVNPDWAGDTSQSLVSGALEVGASFEIEFTVSLDPDAGGIAMSLENLATATGQGTNPDGSPMRDGNGDPIIASDNSDNGSDPENDSEFGEATPILIADLGIAKTIVGTPVLSFSGNFTVTFQVAIENTGTVDLANLSLLEDLSGQFAGALVGTSGLTLVNGPTNPASNIATVSYTHLTLPTTPYV